MIVPFSSHSGKKNPQRRAINGEKSKKAIINKNHQLLIRTMNIIDIFNLIGKKMNEKKGRVLLTIIGIIIGIFTFTFFIFVSQGLENAIFEQFSSIGANILGVTAAGQGTNGPPTGEGLTDKEVAKVKQVVRDYVYVSPGIFYKTKFEYGKEKKDAMALSYPDESLDEVNLDLGVNVIEGRKLRPGDKGSITLGYKLAKEGFDREIKVGSSLKVGDESFRVVGISEEQGDLFIDNSIFMNFDDIKKISGQETYSVIRIKFIEGADLDYYYNAIDKRLNTNGKEKNVEISSPAQVMEQFNQIIGLLSAIIGFISSVALVVGGINVMNTMYSNVIERTNEISVMKALGATNANIRNLFLIESSMLGLFGSLIGVSLSYGLAEIVSFLITTYAGYNVPIYFDPTFFIITITVAMTITTVFGTYPAIRAANVNPADNLRDE